MKSKNELVKIVPTLEEINEHINESYVCLGNFKNKKILVIKQQLSDIEIYNIIVGFLKIKLNKFGINIFSKSECNCSAFTQRNISIISGMTVYAEANSNSIDDPYESYHPEKIFLSIVNTPDYNFICTFGDENITDSVETFDKIKNKKNFKKIHKVYDSTKFEVMVGEISTFLLSKLNKRILR